MASRPRYRLVLEAEPGDVPPVIRLRAALKHLWRVRGLKCIEAVEVTDDEHTIADGNDGSPGGCLAPAVFNRLRGAAGTD